MSFIRFLSYLVISLAILRPPSFLFFCTNDIASDVPNYSFPLDTTTYILTPHLISPHSPLFRVILIHLWTGVHNYGSTCTTKERNGAESETKFAKSLPFCDNPAFFSFQMRQMNLSLHGKQNTGIGFLCSFHNNFPQHTFYRFFICYKSKDNRKQCLLFCTFISA